MPLPVFVGKLPGTIIKVPIAGSGSFGHAGARAGRHVTLIDSNPEAIEVMTKRLAQGSLQQYVDSLKTSPNEELKAFGETMEKLRLQLETYLNEATRRAYAQVGRPEAAFD